MSGPAYVAAKKNHGPKAEAGRVPVGVGGQEDHHHVTAQLGPSKSSPHRTLRLRTAPASRSGYLLHGRGGHCGVVPQPGLFAGGRTGGEPVADQVVVVRNPVEERAG